MGPAGMPFYHDQQSTCMSRPAVAESTFSEVMQPSPDTISGPAERLTPPVRRMTAQMPPGQTTETSGSDGESFAEFISRMAQKFNEGTIPAIPEVERLVFLCPILQHPPPPLEEVSIPFHTFTCLTSSTFGQRSLCM